MSLIESVKKKIRSWLDIVPAPDSAIVIAAHDTFERNAARNRLWYRGDPSELHQFFTQDATDLVSKSRFWAALPSQGLTIRKIHSGLPGMIIDTLTDIVVTDLQQIEFADDKTVGEAHASWKAIEKDNKFNKLVAQAVSEVLIAGDGAFKINFDTDISEYPILEFYSGELVDYTIVRGRIQEVNFYSRHGVGKKVYTLKETRGYGYIRYELLNSSGEVVELSTVAELAHLVDVVYPDDDYMMAVPMMIYRSPKWEGRGRSIFDLKNDSFDALDETISQWQDAIRLGRIKRYIPESLIPHDPKTGKPMPVNPFDNQFTALAETMSETGESKIQTEQPEIQYEGYLNSYISSLDRCLQGLISPSTLGIDVKKLDNAEAQREKEKTTLYTRDKIIDVLSEVLPELVNVTLRSFATLNGQESEDLNISVVFGQYANPSFEAQVETIGKAAGSQIMSIEAQVEELWGDAKDEQWKAKEVARIKAEKGIVSMDEPSYKPNGFAVEDEMAANMSEVEHVDRLDNQPADRDGARTVRLDEEELEEAQARRA